MPGRWPDVGLATASLKPSSGLLQNHDADQHRFCLIGARFGLRISRQRQQSLTQLSAPSAGLIQDLQVQPGGTVCALDTIQQAMERLPGGCRRLAVQLRLDIDPDWVWTVLTDYAQLSSFIPNLQTSRLLWRRANVVGLEQEGAQSFMGLRFKARVQLELTEHLQERRLSFVMTKGDFRRFEGVWQIGQNAAGTSLLYELTVQGCVGMPIGLIEQRLREDLAANLRAVQQEAQRRAALS